VHRLREHRDRLGGDATAEQTFVQPLADLGRRGRRLPGVWFAAVARASDTSGASVEAGVAALFEG
jgi:hypothetical protein